MACNNCERKRLLKEKELASFERKIVFDARSLSLSQSVLLTGVIRDLKINNPKIGINVISNNQEIFFANKFLFPLVAGNNVEIITLNNNFSYNGKHQIEEIKEEIERKTNLLAPNTELNGCITIAKEEEKIRFADILNIKDYWIIFAGGTRFNTWKWYPYYQQIVDHLQAKTTVIQLGKKEDYHPMLKGLIYMVGRINLRETINFIYHANGIICPLSLPMHIEAALPKKENVDRKCIVLAGGNQPANYLTYNKHKVFSTKLECSPDGGCGKIRCQKIGNGDKFEKENLCENYTQIGNVKYSKCMENIKAEDIIGELK